MLNFNIKTNEYITIKENIIQANAPLDVVQIQVSNENIAFFYGHNGNSAGSTLSYYLSVYDLVTGKLEKVNKFSRPSTNHMNYYYNVYVRPLSSDFNHLAFFVSDSLQDLPKKGNILIWNLETNFIMDTIHDSFLPIFSNSIPDRLYFYSNIQRQVLSYNINTRETSVVYQVKKNEYFLNFLVSPDDNYIFVHVKSENRIFDRYREYYCDLTNIKNKINLGGKYFFGQGFDVYNWDKILSDRKKGA